jgi:hypothetical protein
MEVIVIKKILVNIFAIVLISFASNCLAMQDGDQKTDVKQLTSKELAFGIAKCSLKVFVPIAAALGVGVALGKLLEIVEKKYPKVSELSSELPSKVSLYPLYICTGFILAYHRATNKLDKQTVK